MADYTIEEGVTSKGNILNENDFMNVTSNGKASNTTVNSGGTMRIELGGIANTTTVNSGGSLGVTLGAGGSPVYDLTGDLDHSFTLNAGMVGSSVNILNGGELDVNAGAKVDKTTVNADSYFYVCGGQATDTTVNQDGDMEVFDNGKATGTTVNEYGCMYVSNGTATDTTVNYGGILYVEKDGLASQTTLNKGFMFVTSGGTATGTTGSEGGLLIVSSGGTAGNTTLDDEGFLSVSSGGMAGNTIVNAGCEAFIYNSGTADAVTVNKDGRLGILSGGRASAVTVAEDGILEIREGGTASDVTIQDNGCLVISSTAKLTGKISFGTGVEINTGTGAILDFDLTQTTPGADALVNDLSFITNSFTYTLTVDGSEATGNYKLAGNAAGFNKIISVRSTLGDDYGYLTFGSTLSTGSASYTLVMADDNTLTVDVLSKSVHVDDTTPPVISNVAANITEPTLGGVTVTADFDDDVALASQQYRIGSGDWTDYTGGVTVTTNTTVEFKAVDTAGNETTASYVVTNIIPPVTPDLTGDLSASINYLYEDEFAYNVNINEGAVLVVFEGAVADTVTVNSGGELSVYPGGTAKRVKENGGEVSPDDGSVVEFAPNSFSGYTFSGRTSVTTIHAGTVASDLTFTDGANLYVYDGGIVNDIKLVDGMVTLFSGAVIRGMDVSYDGEIDVGKGATLTGKMTFEWGSLIRVDGDATIDFDISGLKPGNDAILNRLSSLYGTPKFTLTVNGAQPLGMYTLASKANGFDKTITVKSILGETAGTLTVAGDSTKIGDVYYTLGLDVFNNLILSISEEPATIAGLTGDMNTNIDLSDGMVGKDINILSGGALFVSGGATADSVTVNFGGILYVSEGGKATLVKENGGYVRFDNAAAVTFMPNSFGGFTYSDGNWPTVHSGTVASDLTIDESAILFVYSGGIVSNTKMNAGGSAFLSSGGIASNTVINDGGALVLAGSGAVADGVTVNNGGKLVISSGVITGKITFGTDADFTLYHGATLKFDLTRTAPDSDALVNDLSFITNSFTYTLTVDGSVANGKYNLAGNAAGFKKTITVKNTLGEDLGTLTIEDGMKRIGDVSYTLARDASDNLTVTIGESTGTKDTTPPTISNIMLSTEESAASVTVTATFEDDVEVVSKQYRIGADGTWTDYTDDGVTVTENVTVYFKAVDSAGNVAEENYTVTNIESFSVPDTTPPTITITPNTTDPADSVTLTAVFADDVGVATTEYMIDGDVWKPYTGPVTVTENVYVSFQATDTSGNGTIQGYNVTNIHADEPASALDDGTNDYLWTKKDGWNDANIHVSNTILGNVEIDLDIAGTVDKDGYHNIFGNDGTKKDTGDVSKINVNTPAKLTFTIDSTAAGTFYVYEDGFDKKGNRKLITVGKVSVKAGQTATLKDVCLTATGKYYVAMTAKNVKKAGTEGLYNVNVTTDKFFVDADDNDNNTAKDNILALVERNMRSIVMDGDLMLGSTKFKNFVGFTDPADYMKIDLLSSAYLKFSVTGEGDGKAKFTIWKRAKGTTGKLSKVTSVSMPAKKAYAATTKAQFLDTSKFEYYMSMECTDASKGKGVYYNVAVTDDSVFFDSDDDGRNDVLYDKKGKAFYAEDGDHHFVSTNLSGGTKAVKLDSDPVGDAGYGNFVGYGDAADYAKIKLSSDGNLSFDLKATGNATFVVYRKGQDKKGNDTLEAIQTTKLTVAKDKDIVEKTTDLLTGLEAGEYYVSMTAKSTKANTSGSVFYNVTATLEPSVASALTMPETDTLGISDALSFGQYDTDVLADASASALADLDDKSGWQSLLA